MEKKLLSKRQVIINLVIIAIVTIVAIFYLAKDNIFDDLSSLGKLPIYAYLLIAFAVLGYVLCDSFIIYRSFRGINNEMKYKDCIGMYLYGNLGSSLTPSKAGHYPMKLYYMEKKGNSIDQALSVVTRAQIVYSLVNIICYIIMYIICSINNVTFTMSNGNVVELELIALIGFLIALVSIGIFISLAFIPPINNLLIRISCFFVVKIRKGITKADYIKHQKRKMEITRTQIVYFIKNIYKEVPSIVANFGFLFFNNCLPYFIYLLLGKNSFNLGELFFYFALYQTVSYVTTFFPIPGNAGVAESTFVLVYKVVMGNLVGACLLLWRLFNYYLMVIVDVIYFIIDTLKGNKFKKIEINKEE